MISLGDTQVIGLPAVGFPTGTYDLVATGTAQVTVLKNTEIEQILQRELAKGLPNPGDASSYTLGAASVTVNSFDQTTGTASLTLHAVAQRN